MTTETEIKLPATPQEFRAFLREHGFSKRSAERICKEGFREPNAEPVETEIDETEAAELLQAIAELKNKFQ